MSQSPKHQNHIALLAAGGGLGWILSTVAAPTTLQADVRKNAPPATFKSGGERAAATLEKISRQIETMDKRLANIEAAVSATKKQR